MTPLSYIEKDGMDRNDLNISGVRLVLLIRHHKPYKDINILHYLHCQITWIGLELEPDNILLTFIRRVLDVASGTVG